MKIVFMGTPEFAVPSLKKMIENHEVLAVITQPDRKRGRGKKVKYSTIKKTALDNNIEVIQPKNIKQDVETIEKLKELNPDVIVVVAYGQILNDEILKIPSKGCVNVHGSLLPEYRGPSPIHAAILEGKTETGVTTMLMDEGLDTGDILLKEKVKILDDDTAGTLHDKLKDLGAECLEQTLENLENIKPQKQKESKASYTELLSKKQGLINFNRPARDVVNTVRGLNPWPSAYTYLGNKMFKILKAEKNYYKSNFEPGTIAKIEDDGILIQTKNVCIKALEVQLAGSRKMKAKDFVNGYDLEIGEKLGITK